MTMNDSASANSYFAVKRGNNGVRNGIFLSWDDCRIHVEGFEGAEYCGFPSLEQASEYLRSPSMEGALATLVLAASAQRDLSPVKKTAAGGSNTRRPTSDETSSNKKSKSNPKTTKSTNTSRKPSTKAAASAAASTSPRVSTRASARAASASPKAPAKGGGVNVRAASSSTSKEATKRKAASDQAPAAPAAKKPRSDAISDERREYLNKLLGMSKPSASHPGVAPVLPPKLIIITNSKDKKQPPKGPPQAAAAAPREKQDKTKPPRGLPPYGSPPPAIRKEKPPKEPTKKWLEMFEKLKAFKEAKGHCDFRLDDQDAEAASLARWLTSQRHYYRRFKEGQTGTMSELKIQKFLDIGLDLNEKPESHHVRKARLAWEGMLDRLKKHKETTGSATIPEGQEHKELREWVQQQIHQHKRRQDGLTSTMTMERAVELKALGVEFIPSWEEIFQQAYKYKKDNGNLDIPENQPALRKFLSSMRTQYKGFEKDPKTSKLSQERFNMLTTLGFGEDPSSLTKQKAIEADNKKWDAMLATLEEYKKKEGHCMVPATQKSDLSRWVEKQRREHNKLAQGKESSLTAARLVRLTAVGFVFRTRVAYITWEERLEALREYKALHGHLRVPASHPALGKWVDKTRGEYKLREQGKQSSMTDARYNDLKELGFVFKAGKTPNFRTEPKTWEERFEELLQFKKEHGHCLVPRSNPVLSTWCSTQRKHYRLLKEGQKSRMNVEKALKLTDAGFVFNVKEHNKAKAEAKASSQDGKPAAKPKKRGKGAQGTKQQSAGKVAAAGPAPTGIPPAAALQAKAPPPAAPAAVPKAAASPIVVTRPDPSQAMAIPWKQVLESRQKASQPTKEPPESNAASLPADGADFILEPDASEAKSDDSFAAAQDDIADSSSTISL